MNWWSCVVLAAADAFASVISVVITPARKIRTESKRAQCRNFAQVDADVLQSADDSWLKHQTRGDCFAPMKRFKTRNAHIETKDTK